MKAPKYIQIELPQRMIKDIELGANLYLSFGKFRRRCISYTIIGYYADHIILERK